MTQGGQISTDISSGVVYKTFGSVPASARDEAEDLMARLSALAPRPVVYAEVKVKNDDDRAPNQHSVVQGNMDVSGAVIRAQAAGPTATDALQTVGSRLERRLERLTTKRRRATKRPPGTASAVQSGDPTERPEFYDRPAEQRLIVRKKLCSPVDRVSVSQALFDMDVLDYRFFLFTDESDDKTSIVYEDDGGIALGKVDGSAPNPETLRPDIHVNRTPPPIMSVDEAVSHLNTSEKPFVFFKDGERAEISVLYRRYDGHYGLIVPMTSPPDRRYV